MRRAVALIAILMLTPGLGCSPIRPKPSHHAFFVLTPVEAGPPSDQGSPATMAPAPGTPVLAIARVTVAGYLDRDELVSRVNEQQLTYSKHDLWAEPLEQGISRTLCDDLGALLRPRFLVRPQRITPPSDYSLWVDVSRFERVGADKVELRARYSIYANGALVRTGETKLVEATSDAGVAAAVAAQSRALARMSRDIAAAVESLSPLAAPR